MKKFAVVLYPNFSLQEITCLTSALTVWFGEKLDFIASEDKEYLSEEGFVIRPTKIIGNIKAKNYDCLILPGTMNPLPALYDEKLIDFLREGIDSGTLFAAREMPTPDPHTITPFSTSRDAIASPTFKPNSA